MFPYLGPSWPISALSGDRSANADRAHAVLSHFIVLAARQPYFSEPTRPSPDPVLDVVGAGCRPAPRRSRCKPHLCSGKEPVTMRASVVRLSLTLRVTLRFG